jgi:KUP system potassium uptake protein
VSHHPSGSNRLTALTLAALGVVFGDIGTSPLYTIKETFGHAYGLAPNAANVYGLLSLILWSLLLVVVVKYLIFILRADNRGEGGVLAMLALLLQTPHGARPVRGRTILVLLGVFGTALLLGDGMITPAISVLGAIEGLEVVTPAFAPFVVSATLAILVVLFLVQRRGTEGIGKAFGPITLLWFLTIAALGAAEVAREPRILAAANPWHGIRFLTENGFTAFAVLGAVFLAVTGAEALYADIGHFGTRPIRLAAFTLVLPALVLNYFGQGALLLRDPSAISNPFYLLAPRWFLYPLLILATLAAIVASQALISGSFSLAQQSVQLGYAPRLRIIHTSARERGQIYVPEINAVLMVGTILIVLSFKTSSALSVAYGIAVTGTMVITTVLFAVIARTRWHWSRARVLGLTAVFLTFDLGFLGANVLKIGSGGWVPLGIALGFLALMTTWHRGRELITQRMRAASMPLELLMNDLQRRRLPRVPGTAVFLTSDDEGAPVVLLHHLKHNRAVQEQVVLLSIGSANVPTVDDAAGIQCESLGVGFYRVHATFGFMQTPTVTDVLSRCVAFGLQTRPMETTYYLGHDRLLPSGSSPMMSWRKRLFIVMARNARSASEFFGLPPNRVVELGAQIEF